MSLPRFAFLAGALISAALGAARADAQASPSPFTTGYRYDAAHRVTGTIAPDPDGAGPLHYPAVRNTYDGAGRLVRVEKGELAAWQGESVAPAQWPGFTVSERVDTAYDSLDRKVAEATIDPATLATVALTQTSYDNLGRVDCVAQRMNPAAFGSAPGACTLGAQGSQGPDRITRTVYDAVGEVLKVRKAYGTSLQQDYVTYEYTSDGKQKAVIDANGNRAEMTWDGHDRQLRWIFPSPTAAGAANPADYEEYGYDANGNRTSLRKRDGTVIAYAYDALDRLWVKTVPASASGAPGYSVYTGYDNRGLLLYARFGSSTGPGIANAWDSAGRQSSASTDMGGSAWSLASQYDSDSNRTGLLGSSTYTLGYGYDAADRMSAVLDSAGGAIAAYGYDAAGRRSSLILGGVSSVGYGYDSAGRLASLTHDLAGTSADQSYGFAYNAASQIVARSSSNDAYASNTAYNVGRGYAANGLNQYTAAGPAAFQYDLNGNLTSDGSTTFVYDAENRLVSASGAKNAALTYDPLGRLWQVSSAANGIFRFYYDGDRLIEEYDGSGNRIRVFGHGAGADEPVVWWENMGGWYQRRLLHADHQGSIVALNDDTGNALNISAYDTWGIPNAGNWGRFMYTGQVWLGELGLYYYKARFYSPTLGRFLQTDPIGYKDQVNLYAYVGNDPVDNRDSSGNETKRNEIPVRQIVVVPASVTAKTIRRHDPDSTSGASRFRTHQDQDSLSRRAGETVATATDRGSWSREGDRVVFEAEDSFLARALTPTGANGETFTRVVAGKLENIESPKLRAEALAEVAKIAPEVAKNVATDGQGAKPVAIWVTISIHPLSRENRKTLDRE